MKVFKTLKEALFDADNTDNKITTINDDKSVCTITYAQLQESAVKYAYAFQAKGIKKGDRIVIAERDLNRYFFALWGAILAGAAAIPVIPPINGYSDPHSSEFQRLQHIVRISAASVIITDDLTSGQIKTHIDSADVISSIDDAEDADLSRIGLPEIDPDDTAIILFTSGSTSIPKGVPISHTQALLGGWSNIERFELSSGSIFLNWLPPEHITTLFLLHILPMMLHADQVHVTPSVILSDPKTFVAFLDKYRVNMTFAPNFFYRLLMTQENEIRNLNVSLTNMKAFLNGGEMIHYPTVSACVDLLREKGFPEKAMIPGWGMTETVYGVVYASGLDNDLFQDCVSIGSPIRGFEYRLRKNNMVIHDEDTEGSLEIRGDWVFKGYLNETEDDHSVYFTDDGWFRTGDLAVVHNGGFVITGRESDIFIMNGVNYSIGSMEHSLRNALPEEMSDRLLKIRAIRDADTGADTIYIFVEQKENDEADILINTFRHKAEECFVFSVRNVFAVPSNSIPRTPIGKLDSKMMVLNAQAGKYSAVSEDKNVDAGELKDEENLILFIWAEALGLNKQEIKLDDNFFLIGGDSAKVPQVLQRINTALSSELNAAQFVRYPTVRKLLDYLNSSKVEKEVSEEVIVL